MKILTITLCFISVFKVTTSAWAGQSTNSISDVIKSGIAQSTLILSGKFSQTYEGGGGATSQIEVGDVFKAPRSFQPPKRITLHWLSQKSGSQQLTNSYIFFLQSGGTNSDNVYRDVTDETQPFVLANGANIGILKAQLSK